jgi:integrase
MKSEIDTASKRAKLKPRRNPYWQGITGGRGGVSLGYRKPQSGAGTWVGKIVLNGRRIEQKIGAADDDDAVGSITYRNAVSAALEWSKQQHATIEAEQVSGRAAVLSVQRAVEEYMIARRRRSALNGADAERRLKRHVLSDEKFAALPLAKLRSTDIQAWRDRLPMEWNDDADDERKPITASTLNRLLNDVRAALNGAAERHRRELPGSLPIEIKIGTRAVPAATNARRQILTDKEVAAVIAAAFDVDEDFGRLVLVAAASGARHSQIRRITVGDVQPANGRIMIPAAGKGRHVGTRPPIAVPVSATVMDRLRPCIEGRATDELLLEKWHHRQTGPMRWERERRRGWGEAAEVVRPWKAAVQRAGLPAETVSYALRHTSIVRGLTNGLPVRLVAALHDTSTQMVERHYSAWVLDATEILSRRNVLELA